MTPPTVIPYCLKCRREVVPSRVGKCSWCDRPLRKQPVVPRVAKNLQRALEITTLIHLTEPKRKP